MTQALKLSLFFIILGLVSCGHHRDVRPGTKGVHTVKVQASDQQEGEQNAIKQARHFCEERDKDAAFVSEKKKYKGQLKEKHYKTAKRASKMATILTGSGKAKAAADSMLGEDYTITMKFKCI